MRIHHHLWMLVTIACGLMCFGGVRLSRQQVIKDAKATASRKHPQARQPPARVGVGNRPESEEIAGVGAMLNTRDRTPMGPGERWTTETETLAKSHVQTGPTSRTSLEGGTIVGLGIPQGQVDNATMDATWRPKPSAVLVAHEAQRQRLKKLPLHVLVRLLKKFHVSCYGCIDKDDMIEAILKPKPAPHLLEHPTSSLNSSPQFVPTCTWAQIKENEGPSEGVYVKKDMSGQGRGSFAVRLEGCPPAVYRMGIDAVAKQAGVSSGLARTRGLW
mmetsp:Transcript_78091/g.137814  ORF Transcript_78091/g.137814 Transcript_78091/m.137814 type:complete len:273 (-) Transcript_78091:734-1552(-)